MSDEARFYIATIPAGTPEAAPVTVGLAMPVRRVDRIDWRVPHGSQGLMGWRLTMGGVQVLPDRATPWIITEGMSGTWQVATLPDSGAWQVTGYNTGNYDHSVHLDFHLSVTRPPYTPPTDMTLAQLSQVPDLSQAGPPVGRRR